MILANGAAQLRMIARHAANDGEAAAALREPAMARTLTWIAQERDPDARIIVWAASSHMSWNERGIAVPDGAGGFVSPITRWTPMGDAVKRALGDDLYGVMFLADEGTAGGLQGWRRSLEPAPSGSIEAACRATGREYLFLDLRSLPARPGGAWLAGPCVARPRGYGPMEACWPASCDAFVWTRTMIPSTRHVEAP